MPFLFINKPIGYTSHDIVAVVRKKTKIKKVGHAGTLDPFASGLLIVGVGRESTKKLDEFKNLAKTYIATIKLGEVSDTQDRTGHVMNYESRIMNYGGQTDNEKNGRLQIPTIKRVTELLNTFIGKQMQMPPMYSAKKVGGKKLYQLARKGIEIERQPNEIEIYDIKLLEYNWPFLKIEVKCSVGTYIRTLATDIGEKLGVGAYCEELTRTQIGEYNLSNAVDINNLNID